VVTFWATFHLSNCFIQEGISKHNLFWIFEDFKSGLCSCFGLPYLALMLPLFCPTTVLATFFLHNLASFSANHLVTASQFLEISFD
jgi:hypothetical protein